MGSVLLEDAVCQSRWQDVGDCLSRELCDTRRRWAVEEASHLADCYSLSRFILPQCTADEREFVLIGAVRRAVAARSLFAYVERTLWETVGECLKRGVSEIHHRWALREASDHADDDSLTEFILPQCTADEHETVSTKAARRGLWKTVGECLKRGVSDTQRRWVVREASDRADDDSLTEFILPQCTADERELVLIGAVRRAVAARSRSWEPFIGNVYWKPNLWKTVGECLEQGVSDTQHRWAVKTASDHADDDSLTEFILPQCTADERELVLIGAVRRAVAARSRSWEPFIGNVYWKPNLWKTVGECLEQGVSDTQHRWALKEASDHADDVSLTQFILPQCTADEHEVVMTVAVRRGLWRTVGECLRRGVSDTQHRWAVEEASDHADDVSLTQFILPQCSTEERELVMTVAVRRGLWRTVGECLRRGVGERHHRWAVKEASDRAGCGSLSKFILPQCTAEERELVLTGAARRAVAARSRSVYWKPNLWETKYRWAVEEASDHADDVSLTQFILPQCTADERETVFTIAVRRGLWMTVGACLKGGVSDTHHRWALREASDHADDDSLTEFILPQCTADEHETVFIIAVRRGLQRTVTECLKQGVSDTQHRRAVEEASKRVDDDTLTTFVLPLCNADERESVLTEATKRGLWQTVETCLKQGFSVGMVQWVAREASLRADDSDTTIRILSYCSDDQLQSVLNACVKRGLWRVTRSLFQRGVSDQQYALAVDEASRCSENAVGLLLSHIPKDQIHVYAKYMLCSNQAQDAIFKYIRVCERWRNEPLEELLRLWACLYGESVKKLTLQVNKPTKDDLQNLVIFNEAVVFNILKPIQAAVKGMNGTELKSISKQWMSKLKSAFERFNCDMSLQYAVFERILFLVAHLDNTLSSPHVHSVVIALLATQPVNSHIQNFALTKLNTAWEEVRRLVFRAAVENREWTFVKRLADHTVYDDQRSWAMFEAFYSGEWSAVAVLANHGLTDDQMRRVQRQVAKHADWDTVTEMVGMGGDLRRVREDLETANVSRKTPSDEEVRRYKQRLHDLMQLERHLDRSAENFMMAVKLMKWNALLYRIRKTRDSVIIGHTLKSEIRLALNKAMENRSQYTVTKLLRMINSEERDSLFQEAVKRELWGVARELLERYVDVGRRVNVDLCRAALPHLIEMKQWILVARVMENCVDDTERRQIIEEAMSEGEGSAVYHGISSMDGRMSIEERQDLFQRALSQGMWQALKRLVEEKDDTGVSHRDVTLPAAVASHQWDMVTYCQRYGADINKRDAEGNTLIHKAGRHCDWDTVEGLIYQDADQLLLDCENYTVLHRAVTAQMWPLVKLLVEFHGDINQPDPLGFTPLQKLIQQNQGDIIDCSLLWGRDGGFKGHIKGKTALHAVCEAGLPDSIRFVIGRGVHPLVVSDFGKTALACAVQACRNRQAVVAECVKLGVSTFQPTITDSWFGEWSSVDRVTFSPFALAFLRGDVVVMQILYEAGACSNKELYRLLQGSKRLCDSFILKKTQGCLLYLKRITATPRRLESMCRLVISHHLGVSKPRIRERKVKQLPLPTRMKEYVAFADLTDPNFAG